MPGEAVCTLEAYQPAREEPHTIMYSSLTLYVRLSPVGKIDCALVA